MLGAGVAEVRNPPVFSHPAQWEKQAEGHRALWRSACREHRIVVKGAEESP